MAHARGEVLNPPGTQGQPGLSHRPEGPAGSAIEVEPWADPKSRSTLRFYNLHHRSVRVQNWRLYTAYCNKPYCIPYDNTAYTIGVLESRIGWSGMRQGGMGAVVDALAAAVRREGGEIRTNVRVEEASDFKGGGGP